MDLNKIFEEGRSFERLNIQSKALLEGMCERIKRREIGLYQKILDEAIKEAVDFTDKPHVPIGDVRTILERLEGCLDEPHYQAYLENQEARRREIEVYG